MRQECCQRAGSVAMPLGTRIKFATSCKMAFAGGLSANLPYRIGEGLPVTRPQSAASPIEFIVPASEVVAFFWRSRNRTVPALSDFQRSDGLRLVRSLHEHSTTFAVFDNCFDVFVPIQLSGTTPKNI